MITRSKKLRFKPVPARTKLYANSPLPQMVELANKLGLSKKTTLKLKSGRIVVISTRILICYELIIDVDDLC